MHESIRHRLEELLAPGSPVRGNGSPHGHLASCRECSSEVAAMQSQAVLLRSLRAPEQAEPSPGFYARVMQRIEEGGVRSVWTVFAESHFGVRLAYASLTIAILLGSYVVSAEHRDGHLRGETTVAQDVDHDAPVSGDLAQQRDAVLENIALRQQGTAR